VHITAPRLLLYTMIEHPGERDNLASSSWREKTRQQLTSSTSEPRA
jgi:hypothetical protein